MSLNLLKLLGRLENISWNCMNNLISMQLSNAFYNVYEPMVCLCTRQDPGTFRKKYSKVCILFMKAKPSLK